MASNRDNTVAKMLPGLSAVLKEHFKDGVLAKQIPFLKGTDQIVKFHWDSIWLGSYDVINKMMEEMDGSSISSRAISFSQTEQVLKEKKEWWNSMISNDIDAGVQAKKYGFAMAEHIASTLSRCLLEANRTCLLYTSDAADD